MFLKKPRVAYISHKRNVIEDISSENNTSTVFTSLSIILLAFFAYLCQSTKPDLALQARAIGEIKRQFGFTVSKKKSSSQIKLTELLLQDRLSLLKSSGFMVKKTNIIYASAPFGIAFTPDNRVKPQVIKALKAFNSPNSKLHYNISAQIYLPNTSITNANKINGLKQALDRQGALERAFIDLKYRAKNYTCLVVPRTSKTELLIVLSPRKLQGETTI